MVYVRVYVFEMLIAVFVLSIILLFWFAPSSSFLRIYLFVHAYTSRKKHLLNAIDAPFFFLHCNFSTKIRLKIFFFQTLFFFLVFSLTLNSILLSLSFIRNCFPCGFFSSKKFTFSPNWIKKCWIICTDVLL